MVKAGTVKAGTERSEKGGREGKKVDSRMTQHMHRGDRAAGAGITP